MEETKEFDENGNIVYYKNSNGYEYWKEYDKNNNVIHFKDFLGIEYWYKYTDNKTIKITKQEFEQIKRNKEYKEFISRKQINPFELLDI